MKRVYNALFAMLFRNAPRNVAQMTLLRAIENPEGMKNQVRALSHVAPRLFSISNTKPEYDITADIADAFNLFASYVVAKANNPKSYGWIYDYFMQTEMKDIGNTVDFTSPVSLDVLNVLANSKSAKQIQHFFTAYADAVKNFEPGTADLGSMFAQPNAQETVSGTLQNYIDELRLEDTAAKTQTADNIEKFRELSKDLVAEKNKQQNEPLSASASTSEENTDKVASTTPTASTSQSPASETLENAQESSVESEQEFSSDLASAQNGTAEDKLNTFKQYMTLTGDNLTALRDMLSTVLTDTAANEEEKAEARKLLDVTDPNQQTFNFMVPLRPLNAPNGAEDKNVLRESNVPHIDGFMEWAGLAGKYLYADYEFLFSRHWSKDGKPIYFESPEQARAAVLLVLSKPEKVKNIGKNLSFVGFDEESGNIYRIEIDPSIKAKGTSINTFLTENPFVLV